MGVRVRSGYAITKDKILLVVRPYFEGLREKEEEAGGSGWDARKQKSEFLQRVSITIAKGNSRVLDCMRHDWQSSTAPDLVTSTVHNPRTLAATSDPGTHDPTAATPAGGALVAL